MSSPTRPDWSQEPSPNFSRTPAGSLPSLSLSHPLPLSLLQSSVHSGARGDLTEQAQHEMDISPLEQSARHELSLDRSSSGANSGPQSPPPLNTVRSLRPRPTPRARPSPRADALILYSAGSSIPQRDKRELECLLFFMQMRKFTTSAKK